MNEPKIMQALIEQVSKARSDGVETEVRTFISRPLWERFLAETGTPAKTEPTPWIGKDTVRVFGSETQVIEDEVYWIFAVMKFR